jgi:hypothetical protein
VLTILLVGAVPATPAPASAPATAGRCPAVERPFAPRTLAAPGVVGPTRVLARGRDRSGVPLPPPLTDRGKWQFGWDRDSRIRPGSAHGVVRLTAHTYPRFAGRALGNRLLDRLHRGALLVAAGPHGERLCYRVTRVVRVRAEQSYPGYYSDGGRPRLAIIVCSGVRRGPGDWSHRTIWFASPVDGRAP